MGMTGRQQFFRVELPLAMPLIATGIRLALVQVWATATIAALVAGPGLGRIITDGFFHTDYGKGIAGAVVVAVVALVLELVAAALQRLVDPVPHGSSPKRDRKSAADRQAVPMPTPTAVGSPEPDRTRVADRRGTQKVNPCTLRRRLPGRGAGRRHRPPRRGVRAATTSSARRRRHQRRDHRESGGDKGTVRDLAGQSFPEATLVASMYEQLLDEGRLRRRRPSWSTPATSTWPTFPGGVDVVPEYVGGIVDFLNSQENGADADAVRRQRRRPAVIGRRQSLLDEAGITLLDPSAATDTNAFFVTKDYSDQNGVDQALRPRGQVSVVLAAAPDCEGRPDCEGGPDRRVRHRRHQGPAARLRQRPDLPVGPQRRVPARRDQHHRRHPGVPGLWCCSRTTSTSSRRRTWCRPSRPSSSPTTPTSPASSTPLMAALTTENLTELNGQGRRSTGRSPRTSRRSS